LVLGPLGIGITSNDIIFDMTSLAYIFLGIIKRWDDPRLQALNPGLTLPSANITRVVRVDLSALNTGIHQAFSIVPEWNNTIITSYQMQVINYPSNGQKMVLCSSALDAATKWSTEQFSIGLSGLEDANRLGIPWAGMVNRAGNVVYPSTESLSFSAMEKGGQPLSPLVQQKAIAMDLSNPTGENAWPMSGFSYIVMRTNTYRSTCRVRTETVRFWYWFYTSEVARQLAEVLYFVIPSPEVRAVHKIEETLTSAMFCDNELGI
jgi:phosphate transport system substrate-binding protein